MAGIQWMQCQYLAKGVGVRATCLFLTLTLQTLIISHIKNKFKQAKLRFSMTSRVNMFF